MKQILLNIWHTTRAKDWRLSLVPFVIGCIYLWVGWFGLSLTFATLQLFILSFITTIGFAALGYFINEFFDKAVDAQAGKKNTLSRLPAVYQFILFLGCLATALLPWVGLPADNLSVQLIFLEILLFLLYSLPFPRFKKIPLLSSVTDSGYAYVVPLLLTFQTYSLFASQNGREVLFFFAAAVFVVGLRNITIHHVNDIFKDQRSQITTLPKLVGVRVTAYLLTWLLCTEIILILIWSIIMAIQQPLFWGWVLVYCVFIFWQMKKLMPVHEIESITIHPIRHITDPAYQYIFPAFTLLYIITIDYRWLILIPFHLFIMVPEPILQKGKDLIRSGSIATGYILKRAIRNWVMVPFGVLINYLIYFLFLVAGVNLRHEGTDALTYLKKKFR